MFRWEHGSVTYHPFRKFLKTVQPTKNHPTDGFWGLRGKLHFHKEVFTYNAVISFGVNHLLIMCETIMFRVIILLHLIFHYLCDTNIYLTYAESNELLLLNLILERAMFWTLMYDARLCEHLVWLHLTREIVY